MEKIVQKIPFLRLSVALATGILLASYVELSGQTALISFVIILLALLLLNQFYRYKLATLFGIGIHFLLIFLGFTIYSFQNKEPEFYPGGNYSATVLEAPVEKANSWKSVLRINTFNQNDSVFSPEEKMLVYFSKQGNAAYLEPGDIVIFNAAPQLISNYGNPFEFDYKKFLQRRNIYRQVYLSKQNWFKTGLQSSFSLKLLAEKTRMKLVDIYRSKNLGKNEMDILSALTLGYKAELDPQTKQTFASAGALHVLAVSGLHVGIIYWVLTSVFSFLRRNKTGKFIFVAVIIASLWFYAFLTGLSPSVSRAATMFSFLVIGTNMNRQVNIYNSLAGSAFFLLLVNPNNLFEVGFQLSYSAVFGIVFLQPKFEKLLFIRYKVPRFFWQLLTVSVAAQIATFPFTIYYFNQFPTYFWIANLFVIPIVTALIPLGFSLLIFNSISFLSSMLAFCIRLIIYVMYELLLSIESLPYSVLEVSFSTIEFILVSGMLFSVFLYLNKLNKRHLIVSLGYVLFLLIFSIAVKINTASQKELIVYNYPKNTIVHLISGKTNYIVTEKKLEQEDFAFSLINNTVRSLKLNPPTYLTCNGNFKDDYFLLESGIIAFDNKTFLFAPASINFPKNISPKILINPSDLNEYQEVKKSKYVIVTNKNYNQPDFPSAEFYSPAKRGAYIKKW